MIPLNIFQNMMNMGQENIECWNSSECVQYFLHKEDNCSNILIVDGPYSEKYQAEYFQNKWLSEYCNNKYYTGTNCHNKCLGIIHEQQKYCCNGICSDKECSETKLKNNNKWCLYNKYCSTKLKYPKQILKIDSNTDCSPHPFGLNVDLVYTEQEAIDWLEIDNEC
jgi:hypothetical protein